MGEAECERKSRGLPMGPSRLGARNEPVTLGLLPRAEVKKNTRDEKKKVSVRKRKETGRFQECQALQRWYFSYWIGLQSVKIQCVRYSI